MLRNEQQPNEIYNQRSWSIPRPIEEDISKQKGLLLTANELITREKIELPTFESIEFFDREHPETIKWEDVEKVLAIQNDPRQKHRFEQLKKTPQEFYDEVIMDEKVRVYFVRDPKNRKPISSVSVTLVRGDQLETWAEHGATDVEYHGRGVFSQLFQGALYDTIQRKAFGEKFNENIHAGVKIDGDQGPVIKTLVRHGFVPILLHEDQIGRPTNAERITQVFARQQQGLEERWDTVRFKLPASSFLIGCWKHRYSFLERTGKAEELVNQAERDGVYLEALRIADQAHRNRIDISHQIRDILGPLGL